MVLLAPRRRRPRRGVQSRGGFYATTKGAPARAEHWTPTAGTSLWRTATPGWRSQGTSARTAGTDGRPGWHPLAYRSSSGDGGTESDPVGSGAGGGADAASRRRAGGAPTVKRWGRAATARGMRPTCRWALSTAPRRPRRGGVGTAAAERSCGDRDGALRRGSGRSWRSLGPSSPRRAKRGSVMAFSSARRPTVQGTSRAAAVAPSAQAPAATTV